jgi:hypothetical protein
MKLPKPEPKDIKGEEVFLNFRIPVALNIKLKKIVQKQGFRSTAALIRKMIEELPEV